MDILLQSDGQLYPPRHAERRGTAPTGTPRHPPPEQKPGPPPAPLPEQKPGPPEQKPGPPPAPPPAACPAPPSVPPLASGGLGWEELLILMVAFVVIRSGEKPDLPLLLALAYILFDPHFSLKGLL